MGNAKELHFDVEARGNLMKGIDQLAEAVRVTLGPKGRNVVIDKKFGSPTMTKDGVMVAKEIELADALENMGGDAGTIATRTRRPSYDSRLGAWRSPGTQRHAQGGLPSFPDDGNLYFLPRIEAH